MNNILMLQQKEIKCPAGLYRSLKDKWIFALYSSEILYAVSNTVPQERWSAVTEEDAEEKDQRSRKYNLQKKIRTRFKYIRGHCKEDRNNQHKRVTNRLFNVARKIRIRH